MFRSELMNGRIDPSAIVPVAVIWMSSVPDPAGQAPATAFVLAAAMASRSVHWLAETSLVVGTVIVAALAVCAHSIVIPSAHAIHSVRGIPASLLSSLPGLLTGASLPAPWRSVNARAKAAFHFFRLFGKAKKRGR